MKSYLFKVVVEEDRMEDGRKAYSAHCPALPPVNSWGFTYEEALSNVREAVELYVETLLERGEEVPIDPEFGAIAVPAPAVVVNA